MPVPPTIVVLLTPRGPRYCPHPRLLPYVRALVIITLIVILVELLTLIIIPYFRHHRILSPHAAALIVFTWVAWLAVSFFHSKCEWRPWSPEIKP